MSRNRKSAKAAGSRFEREIADTIARTLEDDRIERRARSGAKDRGDIAGVRLHGQRIVIECKNTARIDLARWMTEAEVERGNDDALVGLVVSKRHGRGPCAGAWPIQGVPGDARIHWLPGQLAGAGRSAAAYSVRR